MSLRSFTTECKHFSVTFPHEKVVQVTINRPEKLNCINKATSQNIARVWELLDRDETLMVGIITGNGRAFCTGADLHEWNQMNKAGIVNDMAAPGLAGLPRRTGKKPIIAAVNGVCMGGGFEMVVNCDVVVASSDAVFSLPEVKRGIVPSAGCLPRLARTVGLQRATELVLTGKEVDSKTLYDWGLVNRLVDSPLSVINAALQLASDICKNSPDAIIIGRIGVRMSWEDGNVEASVSTLAAEWYPRLIVEPNFAEGIQAFVEKRVPNWINSKL